MALLRTGWRGMDRLGRSLLHGADEMNMALGIPELRPDFGRSMIKHARVKNCIASSVHWVQV